MTLAFVLVAISIDTGSAFQGLPSRKVSTRGGQVPYFDLYNQYCKCPTSMKLLRNPRVDANITLGQSMDATSSENKQEIFDGVVTVDAALKPTRVEEEAIFKSAIVRTLGWVGAASLFGAFLVMSFGAETGTEFFAGYLVELSLSVDNLFVFLLLFEYFKVPLESQDRVLNWGILGAIVMRAVMIGVGAAALQNLHEILLVFAGILVYSSVKALTPGEEKGEEDPGENAIVKFSQSVMSSSQEFDGDRFFTVIGKAKKATPLFICMIAVEISDVVFAIDSIPAVFGVTEAS
jgi:TerC family integral membrane protein